MHVWKITQRIVVDWKKFLLFSLGCQQKLWRYLVNFLNVPIYITKQQAPSKVHRNTIISFIAEANKQIFPYFVRLFDFFFLSFFLSIFSLLIFFSLFRYFYPSLCAIGMRYRLGFLLFLYIIWYIECLVGRFNDFVEISPIIWYRWHACCFSSLL